MEYEDALASVLEEQATRFDMIKVGIRMEEASLLCHRMNEESSRFQKDEIRSEWRYDGAQALLNLCALYDESLEDDAAFWNEQPQIPQTLPDPTNVITLTDSVEDPYEEEDIDEDVA